MNKLAEVFGKVFSESLDIAYQLELTRYNEPSIIPELNIEAGNVCSAIYKDVYNFFVNEEEDVSVERIHKTIGRFCLCAGMGAVEHWHIDYKSLKEKGIYTTLIEERGLDEMDEYVYDIVGLKMGSAPCKDFISKSFVLFDLVLKKSFDAIETLYPEARSDMSRFFPFTVMEVNKIMFKIGISIQAEKIFKSEHINANSPIDKIEVFDFIELYNSLKNLVNPELKESFYKGYTSALLNKVIKIFTEVWLEKGYVLDVFEFAYNYPQKKSKKVYREIKYKRSYVRKENATLKYQPVLKRTAFERLFNIVPKTIVFLKNEFTEDMVISNTIYTDDCIKKIPSPLNYVRCKCSKKAACEYFLLYTMLTAKIRPVIFSYEQFKKENPTLYEYGARFYVEERDDQTLQNLVYRPLITFFKEEATIELYQKKGDDVIKLKVNLQFKKTSFEIKKWDEEIIIKIRERPRINLKDPNQINFPAHLKSYK